MNCPKCNTELKPGYAINPNGLGNYDEERCCRRPHFPASPLKAEQVEIVFTAKCSNCGHNETLTPVQQSRLQIVTPPGFNSWNAYWADENKELPENWLEQVIGGG